MEGELFQKVGFIAGIYHSDILHIALRNPKNLGDQHASYLSANLIIPWKLRSAAGNFNPKKDAVKCRNIV